MVQCTTEDQLRIHVAGKKHQAKINKNVTGGAPGSDKFKCVVCNITTTDQNGLEMHLNGKNHQTMLRKGGYNRAHRY